MTATDTLEPPRAASTPIPAGRGRYRLVVYPRQFSTALPTPAGELNTARGRRLDQKYDTVDELTFTLDGHDPAAGLVTELATDVILWRWNETTGRDVALFRGLVDHAEDQVSEQSATVTFTAHDYSALLGRRVTTGSIGSNTWTQVDQDNLVVYLLNRATAQMTNADGSVSFNPGAYLPLAAVWVNPDGTNRGLSGVLRDRAYAPGTVIGNAIDDLAKVQGGFDYDVLPAGGQTSSDSVRIFYPQQGVTRTDMVLVYGANVASVTRTVASGDYANYVRVIGNKGSADPNAAQLFSERWNTDANNVTVTPVGLWQNVENASDVSVQATLDQKAAGDLAYQGVLTPTYTLGLRPGTYTYGNPNMGDSVPLIINEGRLAVNTTVRVVGITYDIGDDGQEDITLTVGRPPVTLARLLAAGDRNIDQLARR